MKKIKDVFETKNYSMFSLTHSNRDINKKNIGRIKNSMNNKQLMSVIIVNSKFEIIDGQHRFEACKQLGLPVYFIICENYGIDEIQILNTNMRNWTTKDYLESYAKMGKKEYIKFKEFMELYPEFGMRACKYLLTLRVFDRNTTSKSLVTKTNKNGSIGKREFENGNLFIPDVKKSILYAEKIKKIGNYYDGFYRITFVATMISLFGNKNFNYDVFMRKLSMKSTELVHCVNVTLYKELIEDIYNYRSREKISLKY